MKLYFYWQKISINRKEIDKNNEFYKIIIQALTDNLNTIKVFYYLTEIVYKLNKELDGQEKLGKRKKENLIQGLASILCLVLDILGFKFKLVNYDSQTYYLLKK